MPGSNRGVIEAFRNPVEHILQGLLGRLPIDKVFPAQLIVDLFLQVGFAEFDLLENRGIILVALFEIEFECVDLCIDFLGIDRDFEGCKVLIDECVVDEVLDHVRTSLLAIRNRDRIESPV